MRFELEAEPRRAEELAHERASAYMSLLQFYTTPAMVFTLISHAAPRGTRPFREQAHIVFSQDQFDQTARVAEPIYQFAITPVLRAHMERTGIAILSSLALSTSCEYEEKLLDNLLVYGGPSISSTRTTSFYK